MKYVTVAKQAQPPTDMAILKKVSSKKAANEEESFVQATKILKTWAYDQSDCPAAQLPQAKQEEASVETPGNLEGFELRVPDKIKYALDDTVSSNQYRILIFIARVQQGGLSSPYR